MFAQYACGYRYADPIDILSKQEKTVLGRAKKRVLEGADGQGRHTRSLSRIADSNRDLQRRSYPLPGQRPDEHGDRHDGRYGGYRSNTQDHVQRDFASVNYAHIGRRLR